MCMQERKVFFIFGAHVLPPSGERSTRFDSLFHGRILRLDGQIIESSHSDLMVSECT